MAAAAVAAALAIVASACGSSSTASHKPALSAAMDDHVNVIAPLAGQGTTITVNPSTAQQLAKLGVKVIPFGTAQASDRGAAVTFPVTSGYAEVHSNKSFRPGYVIGSIEHAGSGLTFSAGAKQLTASSFVVDPGNSMLYASVGATNGVPLLSLNDTSLKVSAQGADMVLDGIVAELTPTAATLLNKAFGTHVLRSGLPLGTLHLVASGTLTSYDEATDKTTEISRVTGQTTSVQLDPTTVQALSKLGISVTPQGTGTFTKATSTVSFPINGGVAVIHDNKSARPDHVDGVLLHQGSGLQFSDAGKSFGFVNFIIEPGDATLVAGAQGQQHVPVADLDDASLQIRQTKGTVHLDGALVKLTLQAADALNAAFGKTAFTPGLVLGTLHTVISGS